MEFSERNFDKMDKANYQIITDGIFNVLKEKNFKIEKFDKGEYFSDGKKAFMIDYDDEKQLISLKTAVLTEGEGVDWKELSSWLMGEDANDRDKESIKNDFCDSVLEQLGAKASVTGVKKIEMPSKKKNADSIDIESFSARFLAVFPNHKDEYKQNVAKYGEFLYDNFFSKAGVEELANVFEEGNKRHISKYFDLLNLAYVNGDQNVSSTVVYTIICGRLYSEKSYEKEIDNQLEKYPYLSTAVRHAKKILANPKAREKYM